MSAPFSFEVLARDGRARRGRLTLPHGIDRDAGVHAGRHARRRQRRDGRTAVSELGAEIILANTYHLHLRPGDDLDRARSAVCIAFIGWPRPILTDSGGYQVFSSRGARDV